MHVSDLAPGHLAALATASKFSFQDGFRVFDLGSGKGHSVREVVAAMEAVSVRLISMRAMGRKDGDVAVCMADPSRVEVGLGWRTEKTLEICSEDMCRFLGIKAANNGLAM
jgi:UDP-glucose 4-epimerase